MKGWGGSLRLPGSKKNPEAPERGLPSPACRPPSGFSSTSVSGDGAQLEPKPILARTEAEVLSSGGVKPMLSPGRSLRLLSDFSFLLDFQNA